ncbi:hypothetical protein V8C37DRAFT_395782 [Trichoderma ceciliae]
MAESPHSQAKRRRTSTSETNKYPVVAGYRISTYAAPGRVMTLNEQKMIYHAWRKSGSPHNPLCYICRKPGSMLDCGACCRSYHQICVAEPPERQRAFYCEACTKRGWHIQPPLFEDEKSGHSHLQPANEPVQNETANLEEANPGLETPNNIILKNENTKPDSLDESPSQLASSKSSSEEHTNSGQGDVIRSLKSLRERITILEKENETMRLSSRYKNPRKREYSA